MKILFSLVLAFTLSSVTVLAGDSTGTWKISGDVAGNAVDATCVIQEKDKKLSGTCKSSDGVESTITGKVDDKKIQWSFDRDYNGTAITLVFSGSLDAQTSKITGKIDVQPYGVDGDFTALKEAKKPKKEKPKN